MLLRIEDIDQTRCKPEYEASIFEDLAWLGVSFPGPVVRQSDRFGDYARAIERLREAELVYPCFCTRADIRLASSAPHGPEGPVYPGTCRSLQASVVQERISSGESFAYRLDLERALGLFPSLTWDDELRGHQVADARPFGDFVLSRKETPGSYHLCVVVDDAWQGVDVVTRGEDLFESTHVHRLLQALLGLPTPLYSHHRLVLGEDGKKLSKRDGAETLRAVRERGVTATEVLARIDAFLG